MKKILCAMALLLSSCNHAFATQIVYPTVYGPTSQVTNVTLNGNNNAISNVVNGSLDNTNANTISGYRFYQTVSSLPAAGNTGQVYYLTTDNSLNFDTGSSYIKTIAPTGSPVQGNVLIYGSTGLVYTTTGSAGAVLVSGGAAQNPTFTTMSTANLTGLIGNNIDYVKVSNTQNSGVNGGTSTSGSFLSLIFNTKDSDTASIASLCTANAAPVATCTAANQVVLPAGTYLVSARSPFFAAGNSQGQIRVFNSTTSAVLINGMSTYGNNSYTSFASGIFTLASPAAITVQYQVNSGTASTGLGESIGFGTEVYSVAEFIKIL